MSSKCCDILKYKELCFQMNIEALQQLDSVDKIAVRVHEAASPLKAMHIKTASEKQRKINHSKL